MKSPKKINIRVTNSRKLSAKELYAMTDLYLEHHNISRVDCEKRILSGFDKIVLFSDKESGQIVGFNGVRTSVSRHKGFHRPIFGLYIGQLFIRKSFRGQHPVQRSMMRLLLPVLLFKPWLKPIIWADSLTFKPYILIAQNNKEFYPHPDVETPSRYKSFMDKLGKKNYGENYDPESGCVSKPKKLIMDHVAPIYPRLLQNKYIKFYAEKNPAYQEGNGLLICTPWSWYTAMRIVRKLAAKGLAKLKAMSYLIPTLSMPTNNQSKSN